MTLVAVNFDNHYLLSQTDFVWTLPLIENTTIPVSGTFPLVSIDNSEVVRYNTSQNDTGWLLQDKNNHGWFTVPEMYNMVNSLSEDFKKILPLLAFVTRHNFKDRNHDVAI